MTNENEIKALMIRSAIRSAIYILNLKMKILLMTYNALIGKFASAKIIYILACGSVVHTRVIRWNKSKYKMKYAKN
jgi:hypothetical protein